MDDLIIYRKRLIPEECIHLKNDTLLHRDDDVVVTGWKAIHPRPDLDHGASVYYLKEGYKVSRFCGADSSLLYWYCDIVDCSFSPDGRILGKMAHCERKGRGVNLNIYGEQDLRLFESGVGYFK